MAVPISIDQQLAYWKTKFEARAAPLLEPLLDFSRPPVQSFIRSTETLDTHSLTICQFCEQQHVSLFSLLATALGIALARYTAQPELTFGTVSPDSRRSDGSTFPNPIPLPLSMPEKLPVTEVLQQTARTIKQIQDNRDIPFDQLVVETGGDTAECGPIFQVMLSVLNEPGISDMAISEEQLRKVDQYIVRCDMVFLVTIEEDRMRIACEYDTLLFEPATIQRLLQHLEVTLNGILAEPHLPAGAVPILTPAEQAQILAEWNDTAVDYPRDASVHQLFESQARQTPDNVALVFNGETLSYQLLNQRANQLAHYLIASGIQPGEPVTLFLERSLEMIIAILAVLKAGGVYIPLDTNYPVGRLQRMLADTRSKVILTQQQLQPRVPQDIPHIICLDDEIPDNYAHSDTDPPVTRRGTDLAYIMFTSGSTGQPKGITIRHRSIVRLVKGSNFATLTDDQTFLQLAPISFDAATLEIWGALLNGAKLVIMPPQPPTLGQLAREITRNKVSVLWLTAGLFHQMVDTHPEALLSVRQLLAGGDVLQVDYVNRLLAEMPEGHRLINGYGPTENTTFTCCHVMPAGTHIEGTVPIGRPVSNTQVYVLNSYLSPVPVGVPGELFVGGAGLARDYLNQPALTEFSFIPNPFTDVPGERLYKTGDRVRWRPDGTLEFLGRQDNQVKIRGFRVEPGEVEAVLTRYPGVAGALVLPFQRTNTEQFLAAYLLVRNSAEDAVASLPAELADYARQHLPDYMVPVVFEVVPEYPLTPNGKIDRDALPVPVIGRKNADREYVEPASDVEKVLANLWRELLGVNQVGIDDNFFALGGHSLLATQLMARIQRIFRIEPSLASFFSEPTITGLIRTLTQQEPKPGQVKTAAQLYLKIRGMSHEEMQETLKQKQKQSQGKNI
jgi:amino acid adenylation domain-containing protein